MLEPRLTDRKSPQITMYELVLYKSTNSNNFFSDQNGAVHNDNEQLKDGDINIANIGKKLFEKTFIY
jgi:hypothetical protein